MTHFTQAIVVEGRYDRIRLSSVTDALVVATEGFAIYTDKEKQAFIKQLAASCGIIILTDSDAAGFRIRKFLTDIAGGGDVRHAYIPEIPGKERRKPRPGSAGLIGVEGAPGDVLEQALLTAASPGENPRAGRLVTPADFYGDGLSGRPGSAERRRQLYALAGIPSRMSLSGALAVLNRTVGYEGYRALLARVSSGPA